MVDIRLAVVGSRSFNEPKTCWEILEKIKEDADYNYIEIISGGARGADIYGENYADYYKIPKKIFLPDWKKYGKRAGFLRNVDIIKNCDVCVAFWDGESHGTAHDLELCKQYNKVCYIYNYITKELYINE